MLMLHSFFSCCQTDRELESLPIVCFEKNGCLGLQWLGKEACAQSVINAINDKRDKLSVRGNFLDSNSYLLPFNLTEIKDAKVEVTFNEDTDDVIGMDLILLNGTLTIPLTEFIKDRYKKEESEKISADVELYHYGEENEISNIFVNYESEKIPIGKFLSKPLEYQ